MSAAMFEKGAFLEIEDRPYKILREIQDGPWQLEDQRNGRIREESLTELHQMYAKSELIFLNGINQDMDQAKAEARRKRDQVAMIQIGPEELGKLREKLAYVKAIESLPTSRSMVEPAIRQVWEQLGSNRKPPHWNTVVKWRNKYVRHGRDGHVLRIQNHRKGNRQRRYGANLLKIVEDAVESVFLRPERKTVEDTLNTAIVAVERENRLSPAEKQLPLPTRRLVQAAIDNIDAFDRYAARYGSYAATVKFRSVQHINVTDRPLECVEIDHTQLDWMVVDAETGMPWGRPYLTLCIDRHTRCILGLWVSFEPPSYLTVARCLKEALMPKVTLQETYPHIDNPWLSFGLMEKIRVDNGNEFHSESLEAFCLASGIELQYTPRKTPWWKGVVERAIGTINRGVAHGNPGTTFSNIFEKGDYDPEKHAVITLDELKMILHKWVADVYHQAPRRGIDGMTPAEKWASSISQGDIPLVGNAAYLDAILGRVDRRVLTHKGIELDGLFYNSPELAGLRRRLGDKLQVELRVDDGDIGHIHVISPDNKEMFHVPCLDQEYAAGTTSWQHKVCKRYASLNLDLGHNPNAWRHAKEEISEFVRAKLLGKRKKVNAKAARFANGDSKSLRQKTENKSAEPVSDPDLMASGTPAFLAEASASPITKKFTPMFTSRTTNQLA